MSGFSGLCKFLREDQRDSQLSATLGNARFQGIWENPLALYAVVTQYVSCCSGISDNVVFPPNVKYDPKQLPGVREAILEMSVILDDERNQLVDFPQRFQGQTTFFFPDSHKNFTEQDIATFDLSSVLVEAFVFFDAKRAASGNIPDWLRDNFQITNESARTSKKDSQGYTIFKSGPLSRLSIGGNACESSAPSDTLMYFVSFANVDIAGGNLADLERRGTGKGNEEVEKLLRSSRLVNHLTACFLDPPRNVSQKSPTSSATAATLTKNRTPAAELEHLFHRADILAVTRSWSEAFDASVLARDLALDLKDPRAAAVEARVRSLNCIIWAKERLALSRALLLCLRHPSQKTVSRDTLFSLKSCLESLSSQVREAESTREVEKLIRKTQSTLAITMVAGLEPIWIRNPSGLQGWTDLELLQRLKQISGRGDIVVNVLQLLFQLVEFNMNPDMTPPPPPPELLYLLAEISEWLKTEFRWRQSGEVAVTKMMNWKNRVAAEARDVLRIAIPALFNQDREDFGDLMPVLNSLIIDIFKGIYSFDPSVMEVSSVPVALWRLDAAGLILRQKMDRISRHHTVLGAFTDRPGDLEIYILQNLHIIQDVFDVYVTPQPKYSSDTLKPASDCLLALEAVRHLAEQYAGAPGSFVGHPKVEHLVERLSSVVAATTFNILNPHLLSSPPSLMISLLIIENALHALTFWAAGGLVGPETVRRVIFHLCGSERNSRQSSTSSNFRSSVQSTSLVMSWWRSEDLGVQLMGCDVIKALISFTSTIVGAGVIERNMKGIDQMEEQDSLLDSVLDVASLFARHILVSSATHLHLLSKSKLRALAQIVKLFNLLLRDFSFSTSSSHSPTQMEVLQTFGCPGHSQRALLSIVKSLCDPPRFLSQSEEILLSESFDLLRWLLLFRSNHNSEWELETEVVKSIQLILTACLPHSSLSFYSHFSAPEDSAIASHALALIGVLCRTCSPQLTAPSHPISTPSLPHSTRPHPPVLSHHLDTKDHAPSANLAQILIDIIHEDCPLTTRIASLSFLADSLQFNVRTAEFLLRAVCDKNGGEKGEEGDGSDIRDVVQRILKAIIHPDCPVSVDSWQHGGVVVVDAAPLRYTLQLTEASLRLALAAFAMTPWKSSIIKDFECKLPFGTRESKEKELVNNTDQLRHLPLRMFITPTESGRPRPAAHVCVAEPRGVFRICYPPLHPTNPPPVQLAHLKLCDSSDSGSNIWHCILRWIIPYFPFPPRVESPSGDTFIFNTDTYPSTIRYRYVPPQSVPKGCGRSRIWLDWILQFLSECRNDLADLTDFDLIPDRWLLQIDHALSPPGRHRLELEFDMTEITVRELLLNGFHRSTAAEIAVAQLWERLSFPLEFHKTQTSQKAESTLGTCALPDFVKWKIVLVMSKDVCVRTDRAELVELLHATTTDARIQHLAFQLVAGECVRPTPSTGGVLAKMLSNNSFEMLSMLVSTVVRLFQTASFLPTVNLASVSREVTSRRMDQGESAEADIFQSLKNIRISECYRQHGLASEAPAMGYPLCVERLIPDDLRAAATAINIHTTVAETRENVLTSACEVLQALAFLRSNADGSDANSLFSFFSQTGKSEEGGKLTYEAVMGVVCQSLVRSLTDNRIDASQLKIHLSRTICVLASSLRKEFHVFNFDAVVMSSKDTIFMLLGTVLSVSIVALRQTDEDSRRSDIHIICSNICQALLHLFNFGFSDSPQPLDDRSARQMFLRSWCRRFGEDLGAFIQSCVQRDQIKTEALGLGFESEELSPLSRGLLLLSSLLDRLHSKSSDMSMGTVETMLPPHTVAAIIRSLFPAHEGRESCVQNPNAFVIVGWLLQMTRSRLGSLAIFEGKFMSVMQGGVATRTVPWLQEHSGAQVEGTLWTQLLQVVRNLCRSVADVATFHEELWIFLLACKPRWQTLCPHPPSLTPIAKPYHQDRSTSLFDFLAPFTHVVATQIGSLPLSPAAQLDQLSEMHLWALLMKTAASQYKSWGFKMTDMASLMPRVLALAMYSATVRLSKKARLREAAVFGGIEDKIRDKDEGSKAADLTVVSFHLLASCLAALSHIPSVSLFGSLSSGPLHSNCDWFENSSKSDLASLISEMVSALTEAAVLSVEELDAAEPRVDVAELLQIIESASIVLSLIAHGGQFRVSDMPSGSEVAKQWHEKVLTKLEERISTKSGGGNREMLESSLELVSTLIANLFQWKF